MNKKYKLYLSLGLIFFVPTSTIFANVVCDESKIAQIEEYCDNIIHSVFECFFNDQDKTIFSQFISNIIEALKIKRNIIGIEFQQIYDDIIALLTEHKDNNDFKVWSKILIDPKLKIILPEQTQQYIDSISNFKKIKILINKLNITS